MDMIFKLIDDLEKAVKGKVDLNIHINNIGKIGKEANINNKRYWYSFTFSWFDNKTKMPTYMQYNLFNDELEKDKKKAYKFMKNFLKNEIHILEVESHDSKG